VLQYVIKALIVRRLSGFHYTTKLLLKMAINLWKKC